MQHDALFGAMKPATLKRTTLKPARRASRCNATATDETIQKLMGRDVGPRFEFIMERAPKVDEIDV